jgi:hypothetical protein
MAGIVIQQLILVIRKSREILAEEARAIRVRRPRSSGKYIMLKETNWLEEGCSNSAPGLEGPKKDVYFVEAR